MPVPTPRPAARRLVRLALAPAFVALAVVTQAAEPEKVTGANYPLAFKFSKDFVGQHVKEPPQGVLVAPQWIGKTDKFWYSVRTPAGTRYWKVDPEKKSKEPLFDPAVLAGKVSELAKKPFDAATLPFVRVQVSDDGAKMTFVADEYRYEYEFASGKLTKLGKAPVGPPAPPGLGRGGRQLTDEQRQRFQELREEQQQDQQQGRQGGAAAGGPGQNYKAYSPDKKKYVYVYKYNLYLADDGKEDQAVQLTTDGAEEYSFGGGGLGFRTRTSDEAQQPPTPTDRKTRPLVTWAPDSKSFEVGRTDTRGVKDLFLIDSIATPRPKLESYRYPMPGEDHVRRSELYYGDAVGKKVTRVKTKWTDERYGNVHWGKAPGELRFVRRDRLQRNLEFVALNTATGEEKVLLSEGFEAAFLDYQPVRYVEESDEMLWWSERSGWGHYYLYGRDGKLKNAVTSGGWRASSILDVDAKNRLVYLRGNAREAGENVYYEHLYRVRFDGTDLTLLDPGNANHRSYLSPSKRYVVDNGSRVDLAPFAVLRDDKGAKVMDLEKIDLASLEAAGWRMPETFVVKAADGVTDLYGNMWKPFDFDPKKKYPVIAHVYPGPQQEGVTHTFSAYSTNMQLAQLGFIVIQVGHRGGTPQRSKAYHSFGYYNLRDYGLVDKKAAIEQLAARHPFIDLDRVGIYGHSGGGFMSAAAVLQKPYNEFFKAAVASSGNHDNNIYNDNWSERYHGMKEVPVDEANQKAAATAADANRAGTGRGRRVRPPEAGEEPVEPGQANGDRQKEIEEVEKQIAALRKQLDEAKKGGATEKKEAKAADRNKADAGKSEKKSGGAGAAAKKDSPKMKFDIHVPTNAELAANLRGHLLLVHGEIDNNVHPANTIRLVDALIKANKRFDMLILPGQRHGYGTMQPYFTQRLWDFFAEHLLGDRQTGADILEKDVRRR